MMEAAGEGGSGAASERRGGALGPRARQHGSRARLQVLADDGAEQVRLVVAGANRAVERRLDKLSFLSTERLQAYSDGLLSIIATVLVVPLTKLSENSKKEILLRGKSLAGILTSPFQLQRLALCVLSFWFVWFVFIGHGRKFRGLESGSYLLVYANLLELFTCSLLPFNAATAANADTASAGDREIKDRMTRALYFNLLLMSLANLAFQVLAAFTRRTWYSRLYVSESFSLALICLATVLLSYIDVDYCIMTYLLVAPLLAYFILEFEAAKEAERVRQRALRTRRAAAAAAAPAAPAAPASAATEPASADSALEQRLLPLAAGPLQLHTSSADADDVDEEEGEYRALFKKRVEAFTDGVIAISATLIVLDIQPLPSCNQLKDPVDCLYHIGDGCVWNLLQGKCYFDDKESTDKRNWLILAYSGTFAVANLLWSQHHFLFDVLVDTRFVTDATTMTLSGLFCINVSMLPFAFDLVTDYALYKPPPGSIEKEFHEDPNAGRTACSVASLALLFSSSCLLGILLHHAARARRRLSWRVLARFWVVPAVALICFFISLAGNHYVKLWPVLGVPPALLLVALCLPADEEEL